MTKREAILQAIKASLVGVTGVANSSVFRSRVEPFSRGESPAIVVEPVSDNPDTPSIPYTNWQLTVRVSIIVRGDVPDQLADPIIESVHSKVTADLSLGGLAMDVQASDVGFELLEGDQPIGIITMDYRVSYRTLISDLSA